MRSFVHTGWMSHSPGGRSYSVVHAVGPNHFASLTVILTAPQSLIDFRRCVCVRDPDAELAPLHSRLYADALPR